MNSALLKTCFWENHRYTPVLYVPIPVCPHIYKFLTCALLLNYKISSLALKISQRISEK